MPRAKGNRWIVVTGSPSPHNLVAPSRALAKVRARANPVLRSNRPALPESRDPDYLLELQMDAMYASQDAYAIERRMPLADFECTKHGEVYCLACTGDRSSTTSALPARLCIKPVQDLERLGRLSIRLRLRRILDKRRQRD